MARDLSGMITFGDINVEIVAEGVSWNPDIAHDMCKRLIELFDAAMSRISEYESTLPAEDEEDDLNQDID